MKTTKNTLQTLLGAVILALALAVLAPVTHAATPPQLMSYQGYVTDQTGNPLGSSSTGPKNYTIIFRMWNIPSGGVTNTSAELYAEQQTVTVNNGYFSVLLGLGAQVANEPYNNGNIASLFGPNSTTTVFVELTVVGIGSSGNNVTILPRLQLVTSPYSFSSGYAATAGALVNSSNSTVLSVSGTNLTAPGGLQVNGALQATGNATVTGTLSAGSATVNSSLLDYGNATINGTLTVAGNTTVNGSLTAGSANIGGMLLTPGGFLYSPNGLILNAGGNFYFRYSTNSNYGAVFTDVFNISSSGNATVYGNLQVNSGATVNGYLKGAGSGEVDGNLLIGNNATVNGALTVAATANLNGNAIIGNNATVGGALTVGGAGITTSGGVSAGAGITTSGGVSAGDANFSGMQLNNDFLYAPTALILNTGGDFYFRYVPSPTAYESQYLDVFHITTNGNASALGTLTAKGLVYTSDRNLKERFIAVDPLEVLHKVASLPITEWQYRDEKPTETKPARHIGPMAQDFRAAFALGDDDKHIAIVDEGGVALAAIKGLNQKLEEKNAEIEALRESVAELTKIVKTLSEKK